MVRSFAEIFPLLVLRTCVILLTVLVVASFGWPLKRFGVFVRLAEAFDAFASLPKPQQGVWKPKSFCQRNFRADLVKWGKTFPGNRPAGGTLSVQE